MTRINRDEKLCLKCLKVKKIGSGFYNSYDDWHSDGKMPYCKQCLRKSFDENNVATIKEILRKVDKPFQYELWEKAKEDDRETLGAYFILINLNNKYDTYADSVFEPGDKQGVLSNDDGFSSSSTANDVDLDFLEGKWGLGYTYEEYRAFEHKYNKLIKNYQEQTSLHTEGLVTYIRYRVKEEMATAKGDLKDSQGWGALAQKAAQDAKINVSQLSKSDISGGVDLMTQLSEAVETKASVIPLLPKVLEQPYDDADLILWANIDYTRMLEDKPRVEYREIWNFYDDMLEEKFKQNGLTEEEIEVEKEKRNAVFRDLANVYVEPLYEDD